MSVWPPRSGGSAGACARARDSRLSRLLKISASCRLTSPAWRVAWPTMLAVPETISSPGVTSMARENVGGVGPYSRG